MKIEIRKGDPLPDWEKQVAEILSPLSIKNISFSKDVCGFVTNKKKRKILELELNTLYSLGIPMGEVENQVTFVCYKKIK
jgi:hypothetical protein